MLISRRVAITEICQVLSMAEWELACRFGKRKGGEAPAGPRVRLLDSGQRGKAQLQKS